MGRGEYCAKPRQRGAGTVTTERGYLGNSYCLQDRVAILHSVDRCTPLAGDPERHSRIVSVLRISKLDAFFCSLPTHVLLLSGYWPVMGTSAAIFTVEGAVHLLLPSDEEQIAMESSLAERTVFQPARLDAITGAQTAIREALIELFRKLDLKSARVGIEAGQFLQPSSYLVMSSYRSRLHDDLRSAFPDLRLISADGPLDTLRQARRPGSLGKSAPPHVLREWHLGREKVKWLRE